jgi:general secretion pathway protein K
LNDVDVMKKRSLNPKLVSGAALMLSLWALFLLSAMVISWALDIDSRLALSANANRVLEAEAMAASGSEVALALDPRVTSSPNLHKKMGDRESYDARVTGECGRLNLNFLTQAPEDPTKVEILRRYLELKGIELNDRDVMIDSLSDWVSPNTGLHRLNAPPESDDYHPAHAPLTSVDELKKVFGWAEFTAKPGWDEDLTVIGNCGQIDLTSASRDVLRALGISDDLADRFLQLRRGSDGIDGTADDAQFSDLPDVLARGIGLNPQQIQQMPVLAKGLVTFKGPVLRIVSVGRSGDVARSVQMIVLKGGGKPQVISWKEL